MIWIPALGTTEPHVLAATNILAQGTWLGSEEVVAAVIGSVLTGALSYAAGRSSAHRTDATPEIERLRHELAEARGLAQRYKEVRKKLEGSGMVSSYYQPVLLLGPKGVGKTSLLMQWHAPWSEDAVEPTVRPRSASVPILDFVEAERAPHFADPTVRVKVRGHLLLKVHDFPGELEAQRLVRALAIEETKKLNALPRGKSLGVVLVCMLDAEEAHKGISQATREYYNGELFRQLRDLVTDGQVVVERIVLVFNRYDLLRELVGSSPNDAELLNQCMERFSDVYAPLHGICNRKRFCATFTILSRENMKEKNRGAPIVKGEAARAFVSAFAGVQTANEKFGVFATPLPDAYYATPHVY